ncbi:hypothetical protein HELRODRAFT_180798 [Helobdella robusta]|uniref:Ig-like domain-containing protein n=1 Tax=Helobdella robusta TaxID=6412 RepID=T1FGA5_HELRO|nr:hypothetical protein HELRODRAFT_180798 [Helobdella robusta]ESN93482.1 hypothetical protein HELRODRAFT_180798 [Helobdella robusta]
MTKYQTNKFLFLKIDPPIFSTYPSPLYQRNIGDDVTMVCSGEGDPAPLVAWKKSNSNKLMTSRRNQNGGNLTIAILENGDAGSYDCVVSNVYATIYVTSALVVLRPDETQHQLAAVSSTDYVRLSWQPALTYEKEKILYIWYRPINSSRKPWQNVTFTTNQSDEKSWSDDSSQMRKYDVYHDVIQSRDGSLTATSSFLLPPTNVSASYWPNQGINITWSQSANQSAAGVYSNIEYRLAHGKWVNLTSLPPSLTSYNWKSMSRDAVYHFRLRSLSEKMATWSEPSKEAVVKTFGDSSSQHYHNYLQQNFASWYVAIGMLLVIFAITLVTMVVVMGVKYVRKVRMSKHLPYGHVKYSGANDVRQETRSW